MPKALTLEEKKERAEAKLSEKPETSGRRKRNVFNGTEGKLKVEGTVPGYHLHIFNDTAGRIQQALDNGYEFVHPEEIERVGTNVVSRNTDIGDKVRFLVGTTDSGPLYAYLMKIKQEWWEEDQATLQQRNDSIDSSVRKGTLSPVEQGYIPKGGIKMET